MTSFVHARSLWQVGSQSADTPKSSSKRPGLRLMQHVATLAQGVTEVCRDYVTVHACVL